MLFGIHLCFRHKPRIDGRLEISFKPGINVVAGPNGSGKSTLLKAIYHCKECRREEDASTEYCYFDAETMNPHREETRLAGVHGSILRARAMFSSHGETMRDVLSTLRFTSGNCLLLDEPESGHDLSWAIKIRKGLDEITDLGCQVIAASHHPAFWKDTNLIDLVPGYTTESLRLYKTLM